MSSALAKQLDRLRGESARTKAKGRASILFHAREAEDVDAETVHGMATNGFAQLCKMDPRLARFEEPLFSPAAKSFDRDLSTKEANEAADVHVNAFLRAVGPYATTPAGQKTLEWLIRRFKCVAVCLGVMFAPRRCRAELTVCVNAALAAAATHIPPPNTGAVAVTVPVASPY